MKSENSIYHGGQKIESEVKVPLFLYEDLSTSIYFSTGYSSISGTEDNMYITEFKLNDKAKVLDLVNGNQETNQKFINEVMKKLGMKFEDEYLLVKDSYKEVGLEVYGYDIDLALFPQFREEMLKAGFNVLKTYTAFENTEPVGYAVLEASVINFKREYALTSNDDSVMITVTKEQVENETSKLGKSYMGMTGYGNIKFEEIQERKRPKI